MVHLATLCAAIVLSQAAAPAQGPKTLAQEILTKGAALFDSRDAAAMAATYTDNAVITLFKRESDTFKAETYNGRAEIQKGYADIFKDRSPTARAVNRVEVAQFIGADMLLIQGKFTLDETDANPLSVPFVQLRTRQGNSWRIISLQLISP